MVSFHGERTYGEFGDGLIQNNSRILTHCNAGALAASDDCVHTLSLMNANIAFVLFAYNETLYVAPFTELYERWIFVYYCCIYTIPDK